MEEIVAPDFGESVFEASVGRWFKSAGESVQAGESIVELHTDKAVQEINAIRSGVIGTILKQVDDIVRPGEALCEVQYEDAETELTDKESTPIPEEEEEPQDSMIEIEDEPEISESAIDESRDDEDEGYVVIELSPFVEVPSTSVGESPSSTAAGETEVETVVATESEIGDEVVSEIAEGERESGSETPPVDSSAGVGSQIAELREIAEGKPVRRERLSRRRLTAARRMAEVQAEAVMTTTYNEVDMYEVIRIRRDFGEQFLETNGVRLGFMSFFVKAVLSGLKDHPILNSELQDNDLVYKQYYDIGIAVASDHGLVVPVIRDADEKSFAEIEREIGGFAERARTGSFSLADLVGGTFTITNGGVFGSMMSTPILNPPQVGILGMHNIVDRAVVVDDQITIRPMMYLAVTYDHRVVEGAHAVQFLMRIKQSLESAELLMLAN